MGTKKSNDGKKDFTYCKVSGYYDKERDLYVSEIKLMAEGFRLINEFVVKTGTQSYVTNNDLRSMDGDSTSSGLRQVKQRYRVRKAIISDFSLDNSIGVFFDKAEIEAGSKKRIIYFNDFRKAQNFIESLNNLFVTMARASIDYDKKMSITISASIEYLATNGRKKSEVEQ